MIRLRLLGTPEVERDGALVTGFRSRKALALLGYVAVQTSAVPRSHLAGLFWEDLDERRGRANLSWVLHRISQAIPDCLETDRHTVQLRRTPNCWLDIDALEALETGTETEVLAAAVQQYRGEFLEGIELERCPEFEIWLAGERERWRQRQAEALSILLERYRQRGAYERALRITRQLLSLEPWRESTHRRAMALFARCGRWSDALAQYGICRRVLSEELGVEPTEETRTLYERIEAARTAPRHNLPPQPRPFIGRRREMAEVLGLLDNQSCRLLTLLGPGGVGKTRLALEVASARKDAFLDGVWFIPLASVSSPEFLVSTMANGLQITLSGREEARTELIRHLESKEVLLILDSFEHFVSASSLLVAILEKAPEVKLLVTSRTSLNVRWEWRYEVEGLSHPVGVGSDDVESGTFDAVALFQQVACQVNPRFSAEACDMQRVADICQLVEGMPLAIELAAAEVKTHTCEAIAREIRDDMGFLASSLQDIPARHRSLQATFEHSWRLLTPQQRETLMRLSVFRQRFRQEAAEEITDAGPVILESLVDRSLLRFDSSGWYEMHNLLRQYASDKLKNAAKNEGECKRKHAAHYLRLLRQLESHRGVQDTAEALIKIKVDLANVRAAWGRAAREGWVAEIEQSLTSLSRFYRLAGPYGEGETLIRMAIEGLRRAANLEDEETSKPSSQLTGILARLRVEQARFLNRRGLYTRAIGAAQTALDLVGDGNERHQAKVLEAAASMQWGRALLRQGTYGAAVAQLRYALALSKDLDRSQMTVDCLRSLGNAYHGQGAYDDAGACYRQALVVSRELGDRRSEGALLANLGLAAHQQGSYGKARIHYEDALKLAREIGDRWSESLALINLGYVLDQQGAYAEAEPLYRESLKIARTIGDRQGESIALACLGLLFHHLGDDGVAARLSQQGASIAQEIGDRRISGYSLTRLGHALQRLGRFDAAKEAYRQAITLRRELAERGRLLESWAGLARTHLACGEQVEAQHLVGQIIRCLENTLLNDTDEPLRIYLTCYRVLDGAGDSRANCVLEEAHGLLQKRAARIRDEGLRRTFLENVASHRQIAKAYQRLQKSVRAIKDGEEAQISLPAASTEDIPNDEATGRS